MRDTTKNMPSKFGFINSMAIAGSVFSHVLFCEHARVPIHHFYVLK